MIKRFCYFLFITLIIGFACFQTFTYAKELSPSAFYKNKTLEIIVPFSPGGGYDQYARFLAPYIAKYTGAQTTMVNNMPGAAGMLALKYLYSTAKPDGLSFLLANAGDAATMELLGLQETGQVDLTKFGYIGNVAGGPQMLAVAKNSKFKTITEMQGAKEIKIGTTGKSTGITISCAIIGHSLKLPLKFVTGYPGLANIKLAALQGEIDTFTFASEAAPQFLPAGDLLPICVLGPKRFELVPDVPTIYEIATIGDEEKKFLNLYAGISIINRVLVAPPKISTERLEYLRAALKKTLEDQELLAQAKKNDLIILPLSGSEAESLIRSFKSQLSGEEIAKFRFIVLEKYFK